MTPPRGKKISRLEKRNLALFREMQNTEVLKPRFTPHLLAVLILSLMVHSLTVFLAAIGIYWLMRGLIGIGSHDYLVFFLFGLLALGMAWGVAPRFGKVPILLPRMSYPTVYDLADRIAKNMNIPPVDGIFLSVQFTASIGQIGFKRKTYLEIGLPLWVLLSDREKVGLLAHELSHCANGDFARKYIVYLARQSLTQWYIALSGASYFALPLLGLRGVVWIFLYGFSRLLLHENRRSEYLADSLAATVGGTESMIGVLRKTNFGLALRSFLKNLTETRRTDNLLEKFQRFAEGIQPEQLERLEQDRQEKEALYALSHPPLHYRIELLKLHPVAIPSVTLSEDESRKLEREFKSLEKEANDVLLQLQPNVFIVR